MRLNKSLGVAEFGRGVDLGVLGLELVDFATKCTDNETLAVWTEPSSPNFKAKRQLDVVFSDLNQRIVALIENVDFGVSASSQHAFEVDLFIRFLKNIIR